MSLKKQIRNFIYFFLNLIPKQTGASILMYHSVDENNFLFNVYPKDFEKQMQYLNDNKYNVIKLADLAQKIINKQKIELKTVVLTFDDGYKNNYENALPVLKKYGFPATMFLATSYIGQNIPDYPLEILNWQEIKEMKNLGLINFGFHSHTHPEDIKALNKENFLNEINQSKEILKDINLVMIFAYPRGKFTGEQINILKQNGFIVGLTVEQGKNNMDTNPFLLKRNFIHVNCGMQEFKSKI